MTQVINKETEPPAVTYAKETPFAEYRDTAWLDTFLDATAYGLEDVQFSSEEGLKQQYNLVRQGKYQKAVTLKDPNVLTYKLDYGQDDMLAQISNVKIRKAIQRAWEKD